MHMFLLEKLTFIAIQNDSYTGKFGRRRPFIIVGTVGSMLGLLGMAFCQMIGTATGDDIPGLCRPGIGMKAHKTAIGLGVASLWVMNIAVNILMGPGRAIINDLVETSYLVTANSIATACMGTLTS